MTFSNCQIQFQFVDPSLCLSSSSLLLITARLSNHMTSLAVIRCVVCKTTPTPTTTTTTTTTTKQNKTQNKTKTKQNKTKTKQNKQNKTKQNKTKQNKTKQNKTIKTKQNKNKVKVVPFQWFDEQSEANMHRTLFCLLHRQS